MQESAVSGQSSYHIMSNPVVFSRPRLKRSNLLTLVTFPGSGEAKVITLFGIQIFI
jgi:hypothetical protein